MRVCRRLRRSMMVFVLAAVALPAHAALSWNTPYNAQTDAAVLIVLGQSNAEGWGTRLSAAEVAQRSGMSHVFGLQRSTQRVLNATSVTWSPYTVRDSNLGDNFNGGAAVHLAGEFALRWQKAADAGQVLPPLYVIHIAFGGQGFGAVSPNDRWRADRNPNDIDSLYPLARRTLALAMNDLISKGKRPRVIGLHWNQWETENEVGWMSSAADVKTRFAAQLNGIASALGEAHFPIYVYRPRSSIYLRAFQGGDPTKFLYIVDGLNQLVNSGGKFRLMDAGEALNANGQPMLHFRDVTYGIFAADTVHYLPDVQRWFAKKQWDLIFTSGVYGGEVTSVDRTLLPAERSGCPNVMGSVTTDFGGDCAHDVLWTNHQNQYVVWHMTSGRIVLDAGLFAAQGRVLAQRDFNGDGLTDILWHDPAADRYTVWTLNRDGSKATSTLLDPHWSGWKVIAVGDFDGDRKADLLWHNAASGGTVIWRLNGATPISGDAAATPNWPAGFAVRAVADFKGLGRAQVLLHNPQTDVYRLWTFAGRRLVSDERVQTHTPGWAVWAVGDVNGDGKADMLWYNAATRGRVTWFMDGASARSGRDHAALAADTEQVQAADFAGQGRAGVLLRNTRTGQYAVEDMTTNSITPFAVQPAPGWSPVR